jgi:hypothetical protein
MEKTLVVFDYIGTLRANPAISELECRRLLDNLPEEVETAIWTSAVTLPEAWAEKVTHVWPKDFSTMESLARRARAGLVTIFDDQDMWIDVLIRVVSSASIFKAAQLRSWAKTKGYKLVA